MCCLHISPQAWLGGGELAALKAAWPSLHSSCWRASGMTRCMQFPRVGLYRWQPHSYGVLLR